MATADIDQKILGRLSKAADFFDPLLGKGLYELLGLSVSLSRQLVKARSLRRLDTSRDTKSLDLYLGILWTSKQGIDVLEEEVQPRLSHPSLNPEYWVITAKLAASFYHIICLFNNSPPVSRANIPMYTNAGEMRMAMAKAAFAPSIRSSSRASGSQPSSPARAAGVDMAQQRHTPFLRDPSNSIQSDASFVTNPYANMTPGRMHRQSPTRATAYPTPPPGLGQEGTPPVTYIPMHHEVPHPAEFILPALDYIPLARKAFEYALKAIDYIPSNHPMRLSVALEHASFLWDCCHEHEAARRVARRAVRQIVQSKEGMSDADFQDAQALVAALGAIMRRKNSEVHWALKGTGGTGGVHAPDNGGTTTSDRRSSGHRSSSSGGSKNSPKKVKSKKNGNGRHSTKAVRT